MLESVRYFSNYLLGVGSGSLSVKQEFKAAFRLLPQNELKLCVDIGGNKGTFTEQILSKNENCEVVIFEPSALNIRLLSQIFKPYPNVKIEETAVSDNEGRSILYSNSPGSGLASLTQRRLNHFKIDFDVTESVTTIRFEDYLRKNLSCRHIDISKIDIEGHEFNALLGFGEALKNISLIQFEFGGCNIDTRTFFQDF